MQQCRVNTVKACEPQLQEAKSVALPLCRHTSCRRPLAGRSLPCHRILILMLGLLHLLRVRLPSLSRVFAAVNVHGRHVRAQR
jgi:hypothetical protein